MNERTLVLIKPDGISRNLIGTILARYEQRGLSIVDLRIVKTNDSLIKAHYREHADKHELMMNLLIFMSQTNIVAAILEGPNAVAAARATNGATDPIVASPGTIRGDFGNFISRNLVHASDSTKAAEREIALWFDLDDQGNAIEDDRYIMLARATEYVARWWAASTGTTASKDLHRTAHAFLTAPEHQDADYIAAFAKQ